MQAAVARKPEESKSRPDTEPAVAPDLLSKSDTGARAGLPVFLRPPGGGASTPPGTPDGDSTLPTTPGTQEEEFSFSLDEMESRLDATPGGPPPRKEPGPEKKPDGKDKADEKKEKGGPPAEGAEGEKGEKEGKEKAPADKRKAGRGGPALAAATPDLPPTPGPTTVYEGMADQTVTAYLDDHLDTSRVLQLDGTTGTLVDAAKVLGTKKVVEPEDSLLGSLSGASALNKAIFKPAPGYEKEEPWLATVAKVREIASSLGGVVGNIGLLCTVSGAILSLLLPPVGAFLLTVGRFCDVASLILDAVSLVAGIFLTGYNLYRLRNATDPEERARLLALVRQDAMATVMSGISVATAIAPGVGKKLGNTKAGKKVVDFAGAKTFKLRQFTSKAGKSAKKWAPIRKLRKITSKAGKAVKKSKFGKVARTPFRAISSAKSKLTGGFHSLAEKGRGKGWVKAFNAKWEAKILKGKPDSFLGKRLRQNLELAKVIQEGSHRAHHAYFGERMKSELAKLQKKGVTKIDDIGKALEKKFPGYKQHVKGDFRIGKGQKASLTSIDPSVGKTRREDMQSYVNKRHREGADVATIEQELGAQFNAAGKFKLQLEDTIQLKGFGKKVNDTTRAQMKKELDDLVRTGHTDPNDLRKRLEAKFGRKGRREGDFFLVEKEGKKGKKVKFGRDDADVLEKVREQEMSALEKVRKQNPGATSEELAALVKSDPAIRGRWTPNELDALFKLKAEGKITTKVPKTPHHTIPAQAAPHIHRDPTYMQVVNDPRVAKKMKSPAAKAKAAEKKAAKARAEQMDAEAKAVAEKKKAQRKAKAEKKEIQKKADADKRKAQKKADDEKKEIQEKANTAKQKADERAKKKQSELKKADAKKRAEDAAKGKKKELQEGATAKQGKVQDDARAKKGEIQTEANARKKDAEQKVTDLTGKAGQAESKAKTAKAEADAAKAEADAARAEADAAKAEADKVKAADKAESATGKAKTDADAEVEAAKTKADAAKARADAARADATKAKADAEAVKAEVDAAKAEAELAKAETAQAKAEARAKAAKKDTAKAQTKERADAAKEAADEARAKAEAARAKAAQARADAEAAKTNPPPTPPTREPNEFRDFLEEAYPPDKVTWVPSTKEAKIFDPATGKMRPAKNKSEILEDMVQQGKFGDVTNPGFPQSEAFRKRMRELDSSGVWTDPHPGPGKPPQSVLMDAHGDLGHRGDFRDAAKTKPVFGAFAEREGETTRRILHSAATQGSRIGPRMVWPPEEEGEGLPKAVSDEEVDDYLPWWIVPGDFIMDSLVDPGNPMASPLGARSSPNGGKAPGASDWLAAAELPAEGPFDPAGGEVSDAWLSPAGFPADGFFGPMDGEAPGADSLAGADNPAAASFLPAFLGPQEAPGAMGVGGGGERELPQPPDEVPYSPASLVSIREMRGSVSEAMDTVRSYIVASDDAKKGNEAALTKVGELQGTHTENKTSIGQQKTEITAQQDKLDQAGGAQENMSKEGQKASSKSSEAKTGGEKIQSGGSAVTVEAKPEEKKSRSWLRRAWDATGGAAWRKLVAPAIRAVKRKVAGIMESINNFLMGVINQALGLDEVEAELKQGGSDIKKRDESLVTTDTGLGETEGDTDKAMEKNVETTQQAKDNIGEAGAVRSESETLFGTLKAHDAELAAEDSAGETYVADFSLRYGEVFAPPKDGAPPLVPALDESAAPEAEEMAGEEEMLA